jgi:hypothetical protein
MTSCPANNLSSDCDGQLANLRWTIQPLPPCPEEIASASNLDCNTNTRIAASPWPQGGPDRCAMEHMPFGMNEDLWEGISGHRERAAATSMRSNYDHGLLQSAQ